MLDVSVTRVDVSAIPLHLTFTQSKQYCSGKTSNSNLYVNNRRNEFNLTSC